MREDEDVDMTSERGRRWLDGSGGCAKGRGGRTDEAGMDIRAELEVRGKEGWGGSSCKRPSGVPVSEYR